LIKINCFCHAGLNPAPRNPKNLIPVNVESISSIIGKTATSITESAGASLELAKMAEGLQMLVGQFKLRDSIG
jgi:hypothetical protein